MEKEEKPKENKNFVLEDAFYWTWTGFWIAAGFFIFSLIVSVIVGIFWWVIFF